MRAAKTVSIAMAITLSSVFVSVVAPLVVPSLRTDAGASTPSLVAGHTWTYSSSSVTQPFSFSSYDDEIEGTDALSCAPGTEDCVVVGKESQVGAAEYSSDGGETWISSSSSVLDNASQLNGVSCWSATNCVAVGNAPTGSSAPGVAFFTTDGGQTWTLDTAIGLPDPNTNGGQLNAVSCRAADNCVAVGSYSTPTTPSLTDAFYTSDGGAHWSNASVPTANTYCTYGEECSFYGVSCNTGSLTCVAVGTDYYYPVVSYSSDGGKTWSSDPTTTLAEIFEQTDNWLTFQSVSCPSASVCLADAEISEYNGAVAIYVTHDAGITWTQQTQSAAAGGPAGLDCAGTALCVVGGNYFPVTGYSLASGYSTDGGTDRSRPTFNNDPNGPDYGFNALSCPTIGYCVAIDLGYHVWISTGALSVTPDGASVGHERHGGGGGADTYCDCSTKKPIDLATGDYYDTQTDLTSPARVFR